MVGDITFYDFCCFRCVAVNMCINLVFNINIPEYCQSVGQNTFILHRVLQANERHIVKRLGQVLMFTEAVCQRVEFLRYAYCLNGVTRKMDPCDNQVLIVLS